MGGVDGVSVNRGEFWNGNPRIPEDSCVYY